MPASDITSWDPLFKDDYGPRIQNSLNDENNVQRMMTKEVTDESWQGRQKLYPVKVKRNWSIGSIGSRGGLPQAGRSTYEDWKIGIRDLYGRVGFDKYVMKQSRNKKGSWAQVIPQEMDGLVEDLAFRRNAIAWGAGKGILALVNGAQTADATIEVDSPGNVAGSVGGNRYIFPDMYVAFLNASTQAVEGTATVTACAAAGTSITIDRPLTISDNAYIVIAQSATQNSYDKEPEGLLSGVDDGTFVNPYHNLNRTTYEQFKSYILASVGALSLDAMQQPIDATSIRVGRTIDIFACEHSVRRAYLALLEADRRYTGADLSRPDGGTAAAKKPTGKAITFGDIPIMADRDAPYGMLFGINKESWVRYVMDEGSWDDTTGNVLKWVNEFDEFTAYYHIFENYHCEASGRNFRMDGITVNQVMVRSF